MVILTCALTFVVAFISLVTVETSSTETRLIFTRHPTQVEVLSVNTGERNVIDIQGIPQAITFDHERGHVYWAVRSGMGYLESGIKRARLDGTEVKTVVPKSVERNVIIGIAFDWITQNMYYIDGRQNHIGVCDMVGRDCAILVQHERDLPFRLVLDPENGHMYWTARSEAPAIYKSCMDGTSPTRIVEGGLTLPSGIFVDHTARRLYWVDLDTELVWTSDMNGKDRNVISSYNGVPITAWFWVTSNRTPFWLDLEDEKVKTCCEGENSSTHAEVRVLEVLHGINLLFDMTVYDSDQQLQNRVNHCENRPCRYICVLTEKKYRCLCPEGLTPTPDGQDCKVTRGAVTTTVSTEILIRDQSNPLYDILNLPATPDLSAKMTVTTLKGTEILSLATLETFRISNGPSWGVTYDFKRSHIYWSGSNESTQFIFRAKSDGSAVKIVLELPGTQAITGLAYDWIADNIYYIHSNHVGVCNSDGKACAILAYDYRNPPIRIAVHPKDGHVYWTTQGRIASITRAEMDGTGRKRIVRGMQMSGGFVIDRQEARLYWIDRNDSIETSDFSWEDRRTIRPLRSPLVTVSLFESSLFWTDSEVIQSCNKRTETDLQTVTAYQKNRNIFDAVIIDETLQPQDRVNHCAGRLCSHLCVLTANYFRCLCPIGMTVAADGLSCEVCSGNQSDCRVTSYQPSCGRRKARPVVKLRGVKCNNFTCPSGESLEESSFCNGICDCPDGSDEGEGCQLSCEGHPCAYKCTRTPKGPMCSCPSGFELTSDGYSCADIDECSMQKLCDELCVNVNGSYHCQEYDMASRTSLYAAAGVLSLLAVGLIGTAVAVAYKYKQARKLLRGLTPEEVDEFLNGNEVAADEASDGAEKAFLLPFTLTLPPTSVVIAREAILGRGNFAVVYQGFYGAEPVAVKTFKRTVYIDEFKAVLAEAKIMAYIGHHENVVRFLGADVSRISERKLTLVTELSPYGDLLGVLRKLGQDEGGEDSGSVATTGPQGSASRTPKQGYIPFEFSTRTLLWWCQQIASAMEHLESKKIVHGDLAARNVLVFKDWVVKITDFGLSKQLYTGTEYVSKRPSMLPWRWAAPEVLTRLEFSVHSDVWSFGVTAWEIFSLGKEPYGEFTMYGEQFKESLLDGRRLPQPIFAADSIYRVLQECWHGDRWTRPDFPTLREFFKEQVTAFDHCSRGTSKSNSSQYYKRILYLHSPRHYVNYTKLDPE